MRTFVVQMIPDEQIGKWDGSQAANNFCRNLISSNVFDQVVSLIPINVKDDIRSDCTKMPEINNSIQCRFFPQRGFGRIANMLIENIVLAWSLKKADKIWFYNVTIANVIAFFLLWLTRHRMYILLADFTPPRNWYDIQHLVFYSFKRAKGILSLSARVQFKHQNFYVIPGIVPLKSVNPQKLPQVKKYFLLSGRLSASTGLDLALNVFSETQNLPLIITTPTNIEKKTFNVSESSSNIIYKKGLSYESYCELLDKATWALSFRNPKYPENFYNFPSKILEYMAKGIIVISTIDYPELNGFRYFVTEYDTCKAKETLQQVFALDIKEIQNIAEHNYNMLKQFSEMAWAKAIKKIDSE